MAEQHSSAGQEDLRAAIQARWTHVSLVDDGGSEVTRIEIANDSRTSWTSGPSTNPLTLEIQVSGGDSDITTPVTLQRTELFDVASGGSAYSGDNFAEGTAPLSADADTLTVTHDIEQPQL
jgi:hypothetical protein